MSRPSVFDRLGTFALRESVFNRLSISLPTKEGTLRTCRIAFDRLGFMSSSTDTPRPKERKSGLQMKLELIVEVSIRNSLKVKRRTIVHT